MTTAADSQPYQPDHLSVYGSSLKRKKLEARLARGRIIAADLLEYAAAARERIAAIDDDAGGEDDNHL